MFVLKSSFAFEWLICCSSSLAYADSTGRTQIGQHKLMFTKRLWTEPAAVPADPIELHLIYSQAQGYVIHGKFNASDTEALLLASLALQVPL
jgi:hypothetical protein